MEALLSNDNTSQELIARTRLQQDFFSTIAYVMRRPKMLKRSIKRIENYLRNPFLDINFEIQGISPLTKATAEWRVLSVLLQHEKIDLEFCNCDGRTSLFFAVQYPETSSLRLLIDKGAFVDRRDNEGRTSLSLAAELGRLDHVKILVEYNADISSADSEGWTPLFWAVSGDHHETAKYLLSETDANIDHQDVNGRTPLVVAAETSNVEMTRRLISDKRRRKGE
jgi:ankyrin repeat protein